MYGVKTTGKAFLHVCNIWVNRSTALTTENQANELKHWLSFSHFILHAVERKKVETFSWGEEKENKFRTSVSN